jgi:hypothetical protein
MDADVSKRRKLSQIINYQMRTVIYKMERSVALAGTRLSYVSTDTYNYNKMKKILAAINTVQEHVFIT